MKHHHYLLHKPQGYLSQLINNQNKRKNKKLLGQLYPFHPDTMAIGRLDEKSEGLLLLTTDGKESEKIRSAQFEKEYWVEVDGIISHSAIEKIKTGLEINIQGQPYTTKACEAALLQLPKYPPFEIRLVRHIRHGPTSWCCIILREGKFRQVRKMCAVVGFPVLRLVRVRIGTIHLSGLKAGEVKEMACFHTSS